jgi:hypothetical protein
LVASTRIDLNLASKTTCRQADDFTTHAEHKCGTCLGGSEAKVLRRSPSDADSRHLDSRAPTFLGANTGSVWSLDSLRRRCFLEPQSGESPEFSGQGKQCLGCSFNAFRPTHDEVRHMEGFSKAPVLTTAPSTNVVIILLLNYLLGLPFVLLGHGWPPHRVSGTTMWGTPVRCASA